MPQEDSPDRLMGRLYQTNRRITKIASWVINVGAGALSTIGSVNYFSQPSERLLQSYVPIALSLGMLAGKVCVKRMSDRFEDMILNRTFPSEQEEGEA